jgi:hypothetical protein
MHDPRQASARAEARKRGGYNRRVGSGCDPGEVPAKIRTIGDVLEVLDFTLASALQLENSVARNRLLVAVVGQYIQAIQVGQFEERIAKLEELVL